MLSNYYVNPICTPTRTSFMAGGADRSVLTLACPNQPLIHLAPWHAQIQAGRYPIHVGLQHGVITDSGESTAAEDTAHLSGLESIQSRNPNAPWHH